MIAVLIGLGNGHQRGIWLSLAQYAGLVAGVVAGSALAPTIGDALGIQNQAVRPLAAVLVLVLFGSLGSTLGFWLGQALRAGILNRHPHPTELEAILGAAFSALAVLSVGWFLGLSLDRAPVPNVANLVQRSVILRRLDAIFPRPPAFLAGVERVIASVPFPQTFAGLGPELPGALEVPSSVDTAGVRGAERVTFKVEGQGCGGTVTGSAFPYAPGYLVTNAHVVSGTRPGATRIIDAGGHAYSARVVLFDGAKDVAVLYSPGLSLPPLPLGPARRGTAAAVIGYPGGGPEDVQPAVVDGSVKAQGRDIWNQNLVDRQIWVIQSEVRPGNSGGPLVDLTGKVIGVVFAASSNDPQQAYALTADEVTPDLQQGQGLTAGVNTQQYACAV